MRVGFAGTPDFAAHALAAIHTSGYTIPRVLTQPDRPFGRGLAVTASPVKRYAVAHALPILQPQNLRSAEMPRMLAETPLDVLVVAAYGLILPQAVLAWPRHGCLNIHASLLPRWRGAAPIARAIEAGDSVTGITIMQMDAGLDTGPMILRREVAIDPRETGGTLHDKLAEAGARAIIDVLRDLERDGRLAATPQPEAGVTHAAKIARADAQVDWNASAAAIDRKIRAFAPSPGAFASVPGKGGEASRGGAARRRARTRRRRRRGRGRRIGHRRRLRRGRGARSTAAHGAAARRRPRDVRQRVRGRSRHRRPDVASTPARL